MIVNSSRGGGSKDTWVLEDGEDVADRAGPPTRDRPPPALPDLRYGGGPAAAATAAAGALMLARIAHELFWLGRDLARAEHTARMLDGAFQADLQGRARRPGRGCARLGRAARDARRSWARERQRARGRRCGRDEVVRARSRSTPTARHRCLVRRARARGRAHRARRDLAPRCGRRSTRPPDAGRDAAASWRLPGGPVLGLAVRQASAARCSGASPTRTMLRDEAKRVPRRRRPDRVGRHGAADAARRARRPWPTSTRATARRSRCCTPSAASRPSAARCPRRRRAPVARFLLYERAYPDSVAASSTSLHEALERGRRAAARLGAGAAPQPPRADLEFQRRALPDGGELLGVCERVQQRARAVDADIADRYFAGARPRRWPIEPMNFSIRYLPSTATTRP